MTAPTATARTNPHTSDIPLWTGFSTTITISGVPALAFFEKSVQPPGYEGGDPIDTSDMHNTTYRTKAPRILVDVPDITVNAAYDPVLWGDSNIAGLINSRRTITVTFADGSVLAFYGYLRSFIPQEINMDTDQPMAALTFTATNWDFAGQAEAGPALTTEASGT